MNEKQIELLENSGYAVIKEFNVCIEKSSKKHNIIPAVDIYFDADSLKFGLRINTSLIDALYIHEFQNIVTEKALFIMHLNSLGDD